MKCHTMKHSTCIEKLDLGLALSVCVGLLFPSTDPMLHHYSISFDEWKMEIAPKKPPIYTYLNTLS